MRRVLATDLGQAALLQTAAVDRAGVRSHQAQPQDLPVQLPRQIVSQNRVAARDAHPQPRQAPPPPDRARRRLTGGRSAAAIRPTCPAALELLLQPLTLSDSHREIRASGAGNARSYRSGRWSSLGARSCCRIHANSALSPRISATRKTTASRRIRPRAPTRGGSPIRVQTDAPTASSPRRSQRWWLRRQAADPACLGAHHGIPWSVGARPRRCELVTVAQFLVTG